MKKILSLFLTAALISFSTAHSDATSPTIPPVKQVGKAAEEGARSSKKKYYRNIGIAALTIAVALTSLYLVSQHQGKKV